MSGFGEQIAVLDGITIAPGDTGYHGGGSSYPDSGRWPLLPSSAGLNSQLSGPLGAQNDLQAAASYVYDLGRFVPREAYGKGHTYDLGRMPPREAYGKGHTYDLGGFGAVGYRNDLPNVAPKKRVFASPSGSANYSGGSNYPDDGEFPTWAQAGAGMAGFGAVGYRNDLPNVAPKKRVFASPSGSANYSGGSNYPDEGEFPTWAQAGAGMAGLGRCGCSMEGLGTMPNVLPDMRIVASAPQGAQYSGGSSYPDSGRFPLLSSTIGLAGGMGAVCRMPPMTREALKAAIQYRSQMMVNARKAMAAAKFAPIATRKALARTYLVNLKVLCVLRSKAGLPTLPECQQLIARMKKRGTGGQPDVQTRNDGGWR